MRERFGTPCYVYDRAALEAAARQALAVPAPYGLTLRYAMKANPSQGILALFRDLGLHVDASSDFEAWADRSYPFSAMNRTARGFTRPDGRLPAECASTRPPPCIRANASAI